MTAAAIAELMKLMLEDRTAERWSLIGKEDVRIDKRGMRPGGYAAVKT